MKTFRIIGFAMLAILLSLSACSGGGDEPVDPTPKPEVSKSEITMDATLVSNGLSFGSTEGDQTVSFTASENWTLSVASTPSGATWCKASATSGSKGTASVKFTVEANTGYEDRMVSVTIKSGTASKTFTITQKGADALLVTTSKYEIPQSGGQIEVEVKSNLNYQLAVSEDAKSWITEGSGRSLTTRKHSFTISPNEEVDKREGTITFKSGDKSKVVRVYQSGGAIILLSQDEYTVSSEGDTLSVDVKSNVDYGVELPDVDWITDISSSRGMSSHTLEYVVHSNSTYDSRSAFIVFYDRNSDLKDTLTVHQQGIPFDTDYVDLQFDQPGVTTSYNETDGSLSVTYPSGYLPTVTQGNSIVLPAEFHFDIRVIESVSVSGNTLRLTTSQGNMTNLFRNTSFTLTTDASVTSRSAGSTVYTPTAYGYINEKGEYVEMYNESTSSRSSLSVEQDLWGFNENFNDEVIYSGKAGTLSWEKCEFYAGLKGTFTFDFGQKEVQDRLPVGDLKKFSYELNGTVGMDLMLKYDYAYEYEEEDDQIIKYNVIPTGVLRFTVGPVPVVILVYTHLGKQYACQIEGELEATTGVKLENEVSRGLEWTPGSGVVPTKSIKPTFEFHPLTVEAKASAEAKVSYYPQVEIGIYKFLGPWFEPRPYLKETVGAGFRASTDGDNYVGWKAETYNGMDLRMGLKMDFGFWDKEVWTSDLYNWIGDRLLFEAPSRIRTLSPENHIKVEKDESVTAEFMVESFSPITNKYYPCPWALINSEPESGNLDQPLAVTNLEGKATVAWTPDPGSAAQSRATETVDRKLTAKVVDHEGEIIDETGLVVKVNNKGNKDEEKPMKKIKSLCIKEVLEEGTSTVDEYSFTYKNDAISKVTHTEHDVTISYGFNYLDDKTIKVNGSAAGESMTYKLKLNEAGYIESCVESYSDSEVSWTCGWRFEYNEAGQLTYVSRSRGSETWRIAYSDSDVIGVSRNGHNTTSVSCGNHESPDHWMLLGWMYGVEIDDMEIFGLLGMLGKSSKHLPSVNRVVDEKDEYTLTYSWNLDDQGYPTSLSLYENGVFYPMYFSWE